ncbi:MAG: CotH kinase family protein, partial [Salibacteraceae bacterium]
MRKLLLLILGTFFLSCFLYHNDSFYIFFSKNINPRISNFLSVEFETEVNRIAHFLDIKGKVKSSLNPPNKTEIVDLFVSESHYLNLENTGSKESVIKNKWIKAKLAINDSLQNVKLKIHGANWLNLTAGKSSYRVKISKKSEYLNEVRVFNLISGDKQDLSVIAVNKIATEMGLISVSGRMVMLRINGKEQGRYYQVEHISKEFLERKYGITNYAMLSNVSDWSRKENDLYGTHNTSDYDLYYGHIEKKGKDFNEKAVGMYKLFSRAILAKDIEEVKEMIDMEYMGKFLALSSIINDIHFASGDNLKFVYDFTKRKFYPIFKVKQLPIQRVGHDKESFDSFADYNKLVFENSKNINKKSDNTTFLKLLLSDNEVRNIRDRQLNNLIRKQGTFEEIIKNSYDSNERVILASNQSRREVYFQRKVQLSEFRRMCVLASKYLNYGHVYGSFNMSNNELDFIVDAFCRVRVVYKDKEEIDTVFNGIGFTPSLDFISKNGIVKFNEDSIRIKKIKFINTITGDTLLKKHVHINEIIEPEMGYNQDLFSTLNSNNISYTFSDSVITIKPGVYELVSDIIVPSSYTLVLSEGVTLNMGEKVNIIVKGDLRAIGTSERKIVVKNKNEFKNFGVFAVLGQDKRAILNLDHFHISGGSEIIKYGISFTSQFAAYNSDVTILNSKFSGSMGDDGLNIKYGNVSINNCDFTGNKADQVDLDFCKGKVSNSSFKPSLIDSNGDGLDVSGS